VAVAAYNKSQGNDEIPPLTPEEYDADMYAAAQRVATRH